MGTGSGFYDDQMKRRGRCPHCFVTVRFEDATPLYGKGSCHVGFGIGEGGAEPSYTGPERSFHILQCPNCSDVIVWMRWSTCEADRVFTRIYPPRSDHPPAPKEAPAHIARAYEEACVVLPLSPNAAAALARRALQMILREILSVASGNLAAEIDATRGVLPPWIVDGLHQLREVGNFTMHPSKDELTGTIIETETGEAELTIEIVSALFQHLFAGRQASANLAAALAARKSGRSKA
jgi:hypothetical protein